MTAPQVDRPVRGSKLTRSQIAALFARLRELNPHPTTELEHASPFELLVAVILSAQATDVGVNKATRRLFPVANTPRLIFDMGEDALKRHIATIGLFNAKAANVIATCRQLLELHGGEVPRTREALEALPGVGRKTANVVLNTAFGEPTIAVDTHIFRVSNRTGLAPGKTVRVVEDKLVKLVPEEFRQDAHHWLILHGRYTCKARVPLCPACPINDLCRWPGKAPPSAIP
ncbi:MAG: endonuclease III [Pseudomonadota bacterium]